MQTKRTVHSFRGMRKDFSPIKMSSDYLTDAMNIRITANKTDSLFSITCERYPKLLSALHIRDISTEFEGFDIKEIKLNNYHAVSIGNYLVLFLIYEIKYSNISNSSELTKDVTYNSIIKIEDITNNIEVLFKGHKDTSNNTEDNFLNLGESIDSLPSYEHEESQKIYWVDGINQPRVINIAAPEEIKQTWTSESFNFIRNLELKENFEVEKLYQGGQFAPGVIQYCYTYFNKYSGETSIVDVSPLMYISDKDKGNSPEDIVNSNAFKISLKNTDPSFSNIKIYSIHRTSLNATPEVKYVDIKNNPTLVETKSHIKTEATDIAPDKYVEEARENEGTGYVKKGPIGMLVYNKSKYEYKGIDIIHKENRDDIPPVEIIDNIITITLDGSLGEDYTFNEDKEGLLVYDLEKHLNTEDIKKGLSNYGLRIDYSTRGSEEGYPVYNLASEDLHFICGDEYNQDVPIIPKSNITLLTYVDTGLLGISADPTELLYKGGDFIIPKTIAQKDGTLFLGNLKLKKEESDLNTNASDYIRDNNGYTLLWENRTLNLHSDPNNLYPNIELLNNTDSFRTFKRNETYRVGIQCQTKLGKWLDPIFLEDSKVTASPYHDMPYAEDKQNINVHTVQGVITLNEQIVEYLQNNNVIKCRPVVVYPTDSNREVITQGILNPTVFNTRQRYNKSWDAQCSWLFRPSRYYKFASFSYPNDELPRISGLWNNCLSKRHETYGNDALELYSSYRGYLPEYKHNILLPPNYSPLAELPHMQYSFGSENAQIITSYYNQSKKGRSTGFTTLDTSNLYLKDIEEHTLDYYAVDKNIVTLHSPELEKLKVSSTDNLKLRIVGTVLCGRYNKGFNIRFESSKLSQINAPENNTTHLIYDGEKDSNQLDNYKLGSGMFLSGKYIKYNKSDTLSDTEQHYYNISKLKYYTYLFTTGIFPEPSANIEKQYVSNMLISKGTHYFKNNECFNISTADIKLFKGTELGFPLNSSEKAFTNNKRSFMYKGNVDDALTSYKTVKFNFYLGGVESGFHIWENILNNSKQAFLYTASYDDGLGDKTYMFAKDEFGDIGDVYGDQNPIIMAYNSNPHAVMVLDHEELKINRSNKIILPSIEEESTSSFEDWDTSSIPEYEDWDGSVSNVKSTIINTTNFLEDETYNAVVDEGYPYLWVAELYREVTNKFGEIDSTDNLWYPAGKSVIIDSNEELKLYLTYGDTFFNRYDCLKTYPMEEKKCNVVDIASFFIETRLNTDLRYDNNKGNISNIYVNNRTFNLLNDAYNQQDNFFNYRVMDKDIADNTLFPHSIVWSSKKLLSSKIDVWTSINMSSLLEDFDGTAGEITKLYSFNDDIYVFQPKAISRILFNTRALLNTSDGIPITIGNNYNLEGVKKIVDVGSSNIRCINANKSYLYFTDFLTKGIYKFDGNSVESISNKLNFSTWANDNITNNSYVYKDINNNVYINSNEKMLCYSELLGEFESFFSYRGNIISHNNNSLVLDNDNDSINIYELHPSSYSLEDDLLALEDSYITIAHNGQSINNKVYSNIEFRSDIIDSSNINKYSIDSIPFKYIEVQDSNISSGEVELVYHKYKPSNLKKKFNIWRIEFPRGAYEDRVGFKNLRFQNPWVKVKLTLDRTEDNYKGHEIHDITINYFE